MSIERVYLEQGSSEWHEYRASHFNASEAGSVMGVSPWNPKTMADLLAVRRGESQVFQNAAMSRGNELEPVARALVEQMVGEQFTPVVLKRDRYSASLDGLSFDDLTVLEIKCPVNPDSSLLSIQTIADIPQHYWWQLVHQGWVSGAAKILFAVYHPDRGCSITTIPRDALAASFDLLLAAWEEFGRHLDAGTSPETERTDAEFIDAAADWKAAQVVLKEAESRADDARKRLIALGGGKGGGINVSRIAGKKTTEYGKAIKALLPDADLTPWTKTGAESWRIQEMK